MEHRSRPAMIREMKRRLRRILNRHYLGKRTASKSYLIAYLKEGRGKWIFGFHPITQAGILTAAMKGLGWRPHSNSPRYVRSFIRDTPWGDEVETQAPQHLVPPMAVAQGE